MRSFILLPLLQILFHCQLIYSSTIVKPPDAQNRQASCWELIVDGRRLHPQFIVRSVYTKNLDDCQRECEDVLFHCETISYGVNRLKNVTCDLSDWEISSIDVRPPSPDTIESESYVIYSRYGKSSGSNNKCGITVHSALDDSKPTETRPSSSLIIADDVCYSLVTSGRRLGQRYVERSVAVISLDECKLLCTRETSFDCRSFNYRRRSVSTNCDLSREDSTSLDLSSPYVFYTDLDTEFYERTGKGKKCYNHLDRPYSSTQWQNPLAHSTLSASSNFNTFSYTDGYGPTTGCYRRIKSGYRFDSRIVRSSLNVQSLNDCENECTTARGFVCRSFSFRIAIASTFNGYNRNNCDLSDMEPSNLDPLRHLIVDRDADIYERNPLVRNCRDLPTTNWENNRPITNHPQCFLRTRSGIRMDRKMVRYTLSVNSPLECEQECLNARFFTCRTFSYRFSESTSLSEAFHKAFDNCDLTDTDIHSIDPSRDLIDDRYYDTWYRTGYSRDCDVRPSQVPDTSGCYTNYRRGFKMHQRIVRDAIHVRNLAECEMECSRTRRFSCQMFSFRYADQNGLYERNPYNCELTDVNTRDIDRLRDLIEDRDYEIYSRSQYSSCDFQALGSSGSSTSNALDVTVGGVRCRPGSRCRPSRDGGYWFCETDNDNSWDYCCRPSHPCGFTNGFTYPWCYVGTENDYRGQNNGHQWRPCSDRYAERPYAYLHRESPPNATEVVRSQEVSFHAESVHPERSSLDILRNNTLALKNNSSSVLIGALTKEPTVTEVNDSELLTTQTDDDKEEITPPGNRTKMIVHL